MFIKSEAVRLASDRSKERLDAEACSGRSVAGEQNSVAFSRRAEAAKLCAHCMREDAQRRGRAVLTDPAFSARTCTARAQARGPAGPAGRRSEPAYALPDGVEQRGSLPEALER